MPTSLRRSPSAALLMLAAICACLAGCASIPKNRYGIESLTFRGVKKLDPAALRACLTTEPREKLTLGLGALVGSSCGEPPFDKSRWSARLFALPWKEWPIYDEAVLKLDLDRIERWYQARGYYGVRVLDVTLDPTHARTADVCPSEDADCAVDITVTIEEGEPVRVREFDVKVEGELTPELREGILDALTLEKGDIFDEAIYDQSRARLTRVLREQGYARASVDGDVVINRGLLVADIKLTVTPGPICHIGEVRLVSKGDFPRKPVRAVTMLQRGQRYRESALEDAQRSIYALGAFSAVTVRGELEGTEGPEIPIVIELEARRESQILLGAGLLSGTVSSGIGADESISVPQWDVHLLASYEHRNFVGGLRRFRIEERPRMLFLDQFPAVPADSPHFGNTITANFSQPGVIDARTSLFVEARWDNGPDPFLQFFRNDVGLAVGLERGFFKQRLSVRVALHQEIMEVAKRQPVIDRVKSELHERWRTRAEGPPPMATPFVINDNEAAFYDLPSSYRLPFIEQRLSLDLRDDAANTSKGAYFRVTAHEAVRVWDPSWNYLRLTPEARGYVPIGLGMVLAARFAIGWLKIFSASSELDPQARVLGAQAYRLRGGGAMSNRGFGAGEMGDSRLGGTHRWEASLELRIPIARNFYLAAFSDMGDVNAGLDVARRYTGIEGMELETSYSARDSGFRFTHLNTAIGGGLRYRTIIGPIRLDVAGRPPALAGDSQDNSKMDLGFKRFRGAVHLTIGESF